MGLTKSSSGFSVARGEGFFSSIRDDGVKTVALIGNPNVGKSSLFNALTGMDQHTGNWAGKTVAGAVGRLKADKRVLIADLPGTYSLNSDCAEEAVARDCVMLENPDLCIVVCDASSPERGLPLALQAIELTPNVAVCFNLCDRAEKNGVVLDRDELSRRMGVPLLFTSAGRRESIATLARFIVDFEPLPNVDLTSDQPDEPLKVSSERDRGDVSTGITAEVAIRKADSLLQGIVTRKNGAYSDRDRRADRILTGKALGYPAMLMLLVLTLWLTVVGANYPSALLASLFDAFGELLSAGFEWLGAPDWLMGILLDGVYRVLSFVVSVMLPPMAIFFPLFTFLEDVGYLPRIAYNLDRPFKCCGSCGKQSLTMCMGLGCNAAGVVGCRIIESPARRVIAAVTNSMMPCNGRFPTLIALITIFFTVGGGAVASVVPTLMLAAVILLGVGMTFLSTKLLSATVCKDVSGCFALEMPPYRPPRVGNIIVRSVLDRTLYVLGRAAAVAAPMGAVIWLMANVKVGEEALLYYISAALDPIGRVMGLDGAILLAFILGFPANEIVLPVIVMVYTSGGAPVDIGSYEELWSILTANGWTATTALSFILFSIFHWPCSTTLITVKKETGRVGAAVLAAALPTFIGVAFCVAVKLLSGGAWG